MRILNYEMQGLLTKKPCESKLTKSCNLMAFRFTGLLGTTVLVLT